MHHCKLIHVVMNIHSLSTYAFILICLNVILYYRFTLKAVVGKDNSEMLAGLFSPFLHPLHAVLEERSETQDLLITFRMLLLRFCQGGRYMFVTPFASGVSSA